MACVMSMSLATPSPSPKPQAPGPKPQAPSPKPRSTLLPMRRVALAIALISWGFVPLLAQPHARLGHIVFPNSGSPKAQADFLLGVAWLHSFSYEDAIDSFRAAQKIDPDFALAYWGEALSLQPAALVPRRSRQGSSGAGQARRDARGQAGEGYHSTREGLPDRCRSAVGRRRHERSGGRVCERHGHGGRGVPG